MKMTQNPETGDLIIDGEGALTAVFSYKGCNGRTYWYGVAGGNRYCKPLRITSDRALEDARELEENKYGRA